MSTQTAVEAMATVSESPALPRTVRAGIKSLLQQIAALEARQHSEHIVFDCRCGDQHCSADPHVTECVDVGWHCDDYDCQQCLSEAAR